MKERPILFSAPMVRALLAGTKTQTRRVLKVQPPANTVAVSTYHHPDPRPMFWAWTRDGGPVADHPFAGAEISEWLPMPCPYGAPGDRLRVREAYRLCAEADGIKPRDTDAAYRIWYEADAPHQPGFGKLRPGMFMPSWASRVTLEVTAVRVEPLQDISEADAQAEGVEARPFPSPWWQGYRRDEEGYLHHTEVQRDEPPEWMVEPHPMRPTPHLDRSARDVYRMLWESINGPGSWDANPWVWVVEFKQVEAR